MTLRRRRLTVGVLSAAILLLMNPLAAQSPTTPSSPDLSAQVSASPLPVRRLFPSLGIVVTSTAMLPDSVTPGERLRLPAARRRSDGHAVTGALVGAAAGLVMCTAIANGMKDSGEGFASCTAQGYIMLGAGGAVVGGLIGSLIK